MKLVHLIASMRTNIPRIAITVTLLAVLVALYGTWELVQAQEPGTTGATVVVVVDDSKSMQATDPKQRRGLGGRLLIERLFPEDRIATVFFSGRARVVSSLSPVASDENRDRLKVSYQLLRSSGGSDMLGALAAAFAQLEQDETDNPKVVVFLTDGQLLVAEAESQEYIAAFDDLLKSYRANEWPVFPISFGQDVDRQFLGNIAEVTGGGTCDAISEPELVACFQTVLDTFKQAEKVLTVAPNCLAAGEVVDHSLYVDPYARQLSVVVAREDSSGRTLVLDPWGKSVNLPREEGNYQFVNLENPAAGSWSVRFIGPGCFGESVGYIQSDVQVVLESPGVVHAAHESMHIRAELQGRRAGAGDIWEKLRNDMTLSVVSPQGQASPVKLVGSLYRQSGEYTAATGLGDYRLNFVATAQFRDSITGLTKERTYIRQRRVEVVEAPVVEAIVDQGDVHRILPGDSININGRIHMPENQGSTTLEATFSGQKLQLELAPSGAFWGEVVPLMEGKQIFNVSLQTVLAGRYGQVLYPTSESAEIFIEFLPVVLEITGDGPMNGVDPGQAVSLVGRILSENQSLVIDQSTITVTLNTPGRSLTRVELVRESSTGDYRGGFVPGASGSYTFAGVASNLSRNGVTLSIEPVRELEITVKSVLEADVSSLALGELYPGQILTRQIKISNRADRSVLLTAGSDSPDLSFEISPAIIPAGAELLPVQVQITVNPQAAFTGADALGSLSLNTSPDLGWVAGIVIPLNYQIGDYFVAFQREYQLGYIDEAQPGIPVTLRFDFNSPVPVAVEASFTDATGQTVSSQGELVPGRILVSGEGGEKVTLILPLPPNMAPGKYQGEIQIISDPPIPVKPAGLVTFNYRLPSPLERWTLDNWWWVLSVTGGALLLLLTAWGGTVTQRLTLQGRLLIYDRVGLARARREDLRRFARAEVTIGRSAALKLPDSSGVIDAEHAQIVASRESSYPRLFPMGIGRVMGPFGEDVDSAGVPLGPGDTFSIGNYNLEWTPAGSTGRIARLLGDPWWKWGFTLGIVAVGLLAAGFYVVLL